MKLKNIDALLFDSGRVLSHPLMGHWFISPEFYKYINENTFRNIDIKKRNLAFAKAGSYINSNPVIKTKEEELEHFKKYYDIFSSELPELNLDYVKICLLAEDLVFNTKKYRFFDDAVTTLPILAKKYKLAVVSDAWPSLKDVFIDAGLISFFSSFVISSIIGVTKPNPKMYLTALNELKVNPVNSAFIDDNIENCLGAKKVGINAILLCRDKKLYIYHKIRSIGKGYRVINSLNDINSSSVR